MGKRGALLLISAMVVAVLLPAPAAQARRSYCSPTGDYCTGVLKRGTSVRLRIASFSFKGRVKLCVRPPRGRGKCKSFRLHRKRGGIYQSTVRWGKQFPRRGRGRYVVRYKKFGNTLGKPLTFFRR